MSDNDELTKPVGIWRSLGEFKLKEALWPEGLCGLLLGVAGGIAVVDSTRLSERVSEVGSILVLAGALFGIVFAALAIVVSIPSASYLRMLQETPNGGIRRFLEPFLVAAGTQAALLLLTIAYQLLASHVGKAVEHVAFCLISFLFVFGVLDIAGLARQLVRHGILRAVDAQLESNGDEHPQVGEVRRLPKRGA